MAMTPEEKKKKQQERRKARRAAAKTSVKTEEKEDAPSAITATEATAAENSTVTETPKKKVEVDPDKLDAILTKIESQDKELEILRDSVSRSKLMEAEDKRKEKVHPRVYLKVIEDKEGKKHLVTGWKSSPDNKLLFNSENKPVGEILKSTYYFYDGGDTGEVDQVLFTRIETLAFADVIGEGSDATGTQMLTLKMHDVKSWGSEPIKVAAAFVNP